MPELGEMEQRLLSELEEPGDMDAPTLLSETTACTGDMSEIYALQAALTALVEADLVRASEPRPPPVRRHDMPKEASLAAIADLAWRVLFNRDDRHWSGTRQPWLEIFLTDAGRTAAEDVLRRHDGYRWWDADWMRRFDQFGTG
ncbi:MAG: hypothetical protein AB7K67_14520 [Hyphomicrobiaceae bacterium]